MRRAALMRGVPYFTTVAGVRAATGGIRAMQAESIGVRSLQEIHSSVAARGGSRERSSVRDRARSDPRPAALRGEGRRRIRGPRARPRGRRARDLRGARWRCASRATCAPRSSSPRAPSRSRSTPTRARARSRRRSRGSRRSPRRNSRSRRSRDPSRRSSASARSAPRRSRSAASRSRLRSARSGCRRATTTAATWCASPISRSGAAPPSRRRCARRSSRRRAAAAAASAACCTRSCRTRPAASSSSGSTAATRSCPLLTKGRSVLVTGDVRRYRFSKELMHPEVEPLDDAAPDAEASPAAVAALRQIVPEYAAPEGRAAARDPPRWCRAPSRSTRDLVVGHLPASLVRARKLPGCGGGARRDPLPVARRGSRGAAPAHDAGAPAPRPRRAVSARARARAATRTARARARRRDRERPACAGRAATRCRSA